MSEVADRGGRSPIRDAAIVSGGKGTRLQPLTYDLRKELLPLCGIPFLAGVLRRLAAAGLTRVHLVVGADTQPFAILDPVADELGVSVDVIPEPEPLGTGGGLRSAAGRFDGPLLVLNGDILTDVPYAAVARRHVEAGADVTMVLTEVDDTSSYGVAVRDGTRITRFVEKPPRGSLPGHRTVNAGTYVVDPAVLLQHPEGRLSLERDVFPAVLDRGEHFEGVVWDGVWQDLGTPERYREGHRLALGGAMDWPSLHDVPEVEPGVRIAPDADVDADTTVVAPAMVLSGAKVAAGARVGPVTVVGRDCSVGPGAVLEGAVLHDRVEVGDAVVAPGLVAGRAARIQAGAAVGRDVVLGAGEVVTADAELADGERRPPRRD